MSKLIFLHHYSSHMILKISLFSDLLVKKKTFIIIITFKTADSNISSFFDE